MSTKEDPIPSPSGYHSLHSSSVKPRKEWVTTPASIDKTRIDIDGHPVMQAWEAPYMAALAAVAARNGGRVMEVGFGMGLSATALQSHPIDEHVILEANGDVFKKLEQFATSAPRLVTPIGPALWQDSLDTIPDESLDGILYDTYPLNREEQHIHQFDFIRRAHSKLRPGGVLTYCNLTSLGVLRSQYESWGELFEKTQVPYLEKCGFKKENIQFEIYPMEPPKECEYYQECTALVPICIKQRSS